MRKGKIGAQIAHGEIFYMDQIISDVVGGSQTKMLDAYESWRYDYDELMKKIVVKANEDELDDIIGELCCRKIWCSCIYDMGLTQVDEDSMTCVVVEPLDEDVCDELFKHLKLV